MKRMSILAPFAPFVCEEIWRSFFSQETVHLSAWPASEEEYLNDEAENIVSGLHEVLSQVRKFKASKSMALNEEVSLVEITGSEEFIKELPSVEDEIKGACKAKAIAAKIGEKEIIVNVQV